MNPRISVVVATRDRVASVVRLVEQLGAQTLEPSAFEIIVVDDGSAVPAADALAQVKPGPALRTIRIEWSGQAVARHQGATMAQGDILVFLDDDMQVGPGYLGAQLARHDATPRAVVLGRILPDPGLAKMPLFERYHARQLERWRQEVLSGRTPASGQHLCTGNVSMRRADYLAAGGFDASLKRSEDRELGIRLEKNGCTIVYADDVESVHCSDHASLKVWLRRAYLYGRFDKRIAAMHPDVKSAHPWRFWALIHPLSRPIVALSLVAPLAGRGLARAMYGAAVAADTVRLGRVALTLTAFSYALEYFAGFRDECGSFLAFRKDIRGGRRGVVGEFKAMIAAIRADHACAAHYQRKYRGDAARTSSLASDLVTKVGFQMLAWYRLMRFFDACRVPLVPMIISRLIRHLYSADIHWKARIEPGVSIVHGIGLILSGLSRVESGCILFQHVTLGESIDAVSGAVGAPHLGRNVHVGPGATLLGPITVGESSKLGAGAVLMRSVQSGSLVMQPEAAVTSRRPARARVVRRQAQPAA
jgi:serine acetyltransferase/glycosyltransferase involved in cell wall biosynthesis